jgi:hypothetical protein
MKAVCPIQCPIGCSCWFLLVLMLLSFGEMEGGRGHH